MLDLIKGRGRAVFGTSDTVIYLFNSIKFLGYNPPSKYRILYFVYSAIITFICVFSEPILLNIIVIRDRKKLSISDTLTRLQASLNAIAIPVKYISLALSLGRIRNMEGIFNKLDGYYTRVEDKMKIRYCAITGNRLVTGFAVSYLAYELSLLVVAVITGTVPFSLWLPNVDWRRSQWEYNIQISFDAFVLFYVLYHQVVIDSYPAVYIYIIRTHIQLLAKRVERLGYDERKTNEENYNEMLECIVIHQEILKIVGTVEAVISITMFAQFFVAAAILGVTMVNIVIFADFSTKIASIVYYFCVLIQTAPTCYHASYLLADCDELRLAIFHCNWSGQNKRFHNLLIYFLHRSQNSIPLFAMKLVPINLATNLQIAKFSFSLFTFIEKMGLGEKLKGN